MGGYRKEMMNINYGFEMSCSSMGLYHVLLIFQSLVEIVDGYHLEDSVID